MVFLRSLSSRCDYSRFQWAPEFRFGAWWMPEYFTHSLSDGVYLSACTRPESSLEWVRGRSKSVQRSSSGRR